MDSIIFFVPTPTDKVFVPAPTDKVFVTAIIHWRVLLYKYYIYIAIENKAFNPKESFKTVKKHIYKWSKRRWIRSSARTLLECELLVSLFPYTYNM